MSRHAQDLSHSTVVDFVGELPMLLDRFGRPLILLEKKVLGTMH